MPYNSRGTKKCPDCGGESFVDIWKPHVGLDPAMRRFMCSSCGKKFYLVIHSQELLKHYDKQLGRK